jgi:DNA-binding NtrC family response regulator/tetratricopeptide (TPR) repeat protein
MSAKDPAGSRLDAVIASGQAAMDSGRFEEAANQFRTALRASRFSANDEAVLRCHLSEALEKRSLNREQLEAVAKYENPALSRFPDKTQMLVYIRLGWGHSFNNDIPRAIAHFNQALRIARNLDDDAGMGACYFGLGRAYRVVSELRIARDHYISALEHYRRVGNWRELAESYINIGYVNAREGDYRGAMHALKQAFAIIGDREEHDLMGRAYMYLAAVCEQLESMPNVIPAFEKAIDQFRRAGNDLYVAINQNNYAVMLVSQGEWDRAEQLVKECIEVLKKSSSVSTLGAAYDSLAQIYLLKGNLEEADRALEQSLKVLSTIKSGQWNESIAHMSIGRSHLLKGLPDPAIEHFRQAVELGLRLGDQQHLVPDARLWLAEALLQKGQLADANSEIEGVRSYLRQAPNLKVWALLSRVSSKMEMAQGHLAAAAQSLAQSSSIFDIRGNTYGVAVNRLVLAEILERQGRLADAIHEAQQALTVFESLGATLDIARTKEYIESRNALSSAGSDGAGGAVVRQLSPVDNTDVSGLVSTIDGFIAKRLVEASVSRELLLFEAASITRELAASRAVAVVEFQEDETRVEQGPGLRLAASTGLRQREHMRELTFLRQLAPEEYPHNYVYSFSDNHQATFLLHIIDPRADRFRSRRVNLQPMLAMIEQGLEMNLLRSRTRRGKVFDTTRLIAEFELTDFVCASRATARVLEQVNKIRSSDVTVLITGESGTGKELIARAVHAGSSRRFNSFLPFNCSSAPRDMVESQLFGYRKGSFTGAISDYQGVIRAAERGSLFLDEVGDLPLEVQPKLLRFLQDGEIHPFGESHPIKVDVRVVAATNSNLESSVARGLFREDLFHRLNVIRIHVPPLRERREEIGPLVKHYLNLFQEESAKTEIKLTEEVLDLMIVYPWPGNVRQLCNELRRIVTYSESGTIVGTEALSTEIVRTGRALLLKPVGGSRNNSGFTPTPGMKLADAVTELEKQMIEDAIHHSNGNIARAAKALGITRKGLYLKLNRLNFRLSPRQIDAEPRGDVEE